MKAIYIDLPDKLYQRLDSFSVFYGAKSKIVRKAIEEFLDKLEGLEREEDDE